MKTKILAFFLLFSATMLAQHIEFKDITPEMKVPKEFKNGYINIIAQQGDDFLCVVAKPKRPLPDVKLALMDKQMSNIRMVTLPDEYKKYAFNYLTKIGDHYIISMYKGLRDRLLGLLDANLQLVKTYQIGHDFVFERALYTTDEYAILNVNGRDLIKVDGELNVLMFKKDALGYVCNLYPRDWSVKKKDGFLLIRKPESMFIVNMETLELTRKMDIRVTSNDNGISNIHYLDDAFAVEKIVTEKQFGREIFPGDWEYYIKWMDYDGNTLQEFNLKADNNAGHRVEQFCEGIWDESNNRMRVVRAWKEQNTPHLTIYDVSKDKIETNEIAPVKMDRAITSLRVLEYEKDQLTLLLASQKHVEVLAVNLQTKEQTLLMSKECEATLLGRASIFKNDAGYYLITNNSKKNDRKSNSSDIYYNCETALVFINKAFDKVRAYEEKRETIDGVVYDQFEAKFSNQNKVLVWHEEPINKIILTKEWHYYILDEEGNRTQYSTGLEYYKVRPRWFEVSPTEYYFLYPGGGSFYGESKCKACAIYVKE